MSACPPPGTRSESSEPPTAAGTPNTHVQSTTRPRTTLRAGNARCPEIDDGRIDGASNRPLGAASRRARGPPGVEITAPPTAEHARQDPGEHTDGHDADELQRVGHKRRTLVERPVPFSYDERPRSPRCLGPAHHAVRCRRCRRRRRDRAAVPRVPACRREGNRRARDDGGGTALDAAEKRTVIDACSRACTAAHAPLIVGTGNQQHAHAPSRRRPRSPACPRSSARSSSSRTTCGRRTRVSSRT